MSHPFRINLTSVISVITAIIGTVIYLTQFSESGKLSLVPSVENQRNIDSELRGLEGVKFREDGQIAYSWKAERAQRFLDSGQIQLKQPSYLGSVGQRPWTADADIGELSRNGEQLDLQGAVLVRDLIREAEIQTETLRIDLETNFVTTQSPMILKLPNGYTESVGMNANLVAEKVELLSQIRGHYEP
ncbi:LPS export ABC transporter periplasmic protein LptC [Spongiibacter sp. KMU-158]|uniref:LPS export ABC transporter periplasmic protein LptC n=1 Tax=Spongiibacter pelagi TaxID=2760804 RepID=A0A927C4G4_9GAMM|nr:LPS export ABC transporter periplasmic protein LptC [Spongiibacter pelagi]MBD2859707.1 LPS export ABC transporter periplasmic protein LptC [Spongiibacter pelagi]